MSIVGEAGGYDGRATTAAEAELAAVLAEALELDEVAATDDYFDDLGADSMTIAHFCARLRDRPDLPSPSIKDVYHHRTVAALATALAAEPERGDGGATPHPDPTAHAPPDPAPVPTWQYLFCGFAQLVTGIGFALAGAIVLTVAFEWIRAADGAVGTYARSAVFGTGTFVAFSLLPVAAKWVLIGRAPAEQFPVWSPRYVRFWLAKTLVGASPLSLFTGTPLLGWYLRALGAKVGRGALILSRQVPAYAHLLTIGDGAVIRKDSAWSCYRAAGGWIQTGPVTIGRDAFVGEMTVLDIHTSLGDGAQLGHASALVPGQNVPAGEHRQGTPAVESTGVDYRDVGPAGRVTLRRAVYPTIQILAAFAIGAPLGFAIITAVAEWRIAPTSFFNASSAPLSSWSFFRDALALSAVLFFGLLLVGLVLVATVPRLLGRLVVPGRTYPLYGIRYWAHRAIARLTNIRFFTYLTGDSSYIVHYLRWIGYGVTPVGQTGANFGLNIKHDNPYAIAIGEGTIAADGLSLVNAEYSSTSFRVVPVTIGAGSFLGNLIAFPSRSATGDDVLLASKVLVPVDGAARDHVGHFGSPPFEIPRRVHESGPVDDARRQRGRGRQNRHPGLRAKNRHNLVTIGWFVTARWAGLTLGMIAGLGAVDVFERLGVVAVFAAATALTVVRVVFNVFVERASIGFGSLWPTTATLYEPDNWRIERSWKLSWYPAPFNGTPFKPVLWRLLGVRMGRRVFDDGCLIVDKTMATVGDACTLNAASVIQPHSQEDGRLKSDYVSVGDGCTVGIASLVHYGVTMGDGTSLAANSFLTKGARTPPHTDWGENPARELSDDRARRLGAPATTPDAPTRKGDPMTASVESEHDYWREVLLAGGFTTIPRWAPDPVAGVGEHEAVVDQRLTSKLGALAKQLDVPPSAVLLAAHAAALAAMAGEREVVTGYVTGATADAAGRALPCRLTTEPDTWRDLIVSCHRIETELGRHPLAAFDRAAKALDAAGPHFETVFDPTAGDADGELGDAVVLRVSAGRRGRRLALRLRYRADAFDAECAARMAGYHTAALASMAADPDAPHSAQTLLSDDEREFQIDGLAGPRRELPDRRVHELFEERARRHPDRVAAVFGDRELTYAELNTRANRLARALVGRGVESETVVAVVTERNLDWMAAVLAVFKAGGAYLPIEPHFPAERIAATLSRAGCTLVVTEAESTAMLDRAIDDLDGIETLLAPPITGSRTESGDSDGDGDGDDLGIEVAAGQLAYIYFTSGSTGEPKGAMCEHAGMINHLYAKIDDFQIREGETVAQIAPQCFDISLWQLVSALLVGGRTLIVDQETLLDPERFVDTIVDGRVGVMQVVPSYLGVLLTYLDRHRRDLPDLHCVSVTGEALTLDLVKRWFASQPTIALANAYGLTETSDDTNHEVLRAVPSRGGVPLGPAVNNVHVYVVDEHLAPVPLGAPGEIVFSGVCVGRGYVNDPERTRLAYTDDPWREGERLYRSGDYGRWRPDGKLEFLGRRDAQVKIRGFRIEIGEIENALLHEPGIGQAAVVVTDPGERTAQLVAFYTGERSDPAELAARLGRSLPEYMVPAVFHHRDEMPLTDNGKIDRKVLRSAAADPGTTGGARRNAGGVATSAATTGAVRRLAEAWAAVLEMPVDEIAPTDDFFEIGGTSLSAVELVIATGNAISLTDVTTHPVLADLAVLAGGDDRVPATAGLLQRLSEPEAMLVCFPDAGGNAVSFRPLEDALRSSPVAVHAVELPGHDPAAAGEPFEPLDTVADRVAAEIVASGPGRIALWGHSAGAAYAVAVALRLERAGVDVERVFVGAHLLGDVASLRSGIESLAVATDTELAARLDADGTFTRLGDLDQARANRVMAAFRHDCVAAHRFLVAAIDDPAGPRLAAPLTVVVADDDPATSGQPDRRTGWQALASDIDVVALDRGGHHFPRSRPGATAAAVVGALGLAPPAVPAPSSSGRNGNGTATGARSAATNGDHTGSPPVVVADAGDPTDAGDWAADRRDALRAAIDEHGAVLVRGLDIAGPADVAAFAGGVAGRLLPDREALAARDAHPGGVYSSTAWPAHQPMCMHHETSYRLDVPGLMVFGCLTPARDGGAIGVADAAAVLDDLPAALVERFATEGWILTRSFTDEIGLPVADAFGSADRAEIERYCDDHAIELEWRTDGGLRTRQRRQAVVDHPRTGRACWFNQIAFLSEWTMKPEVHDFLTEMYGPDGLPFNTRFGNGDPIQPDVVATINTVYDAHTVDVALEAGDVLLVDNIACAHSRRPYDGDREVIVALADPVRLTGPVASPPPAPQVAATR